jgi:hypothetical protein
VSGARREAARSGITFLGVVAALALCGCPAALPPTLRDATITPDKLPAGTPALVKFAEEEDAKQTASAEENIIVAMDHGLRSDPRSYELLWRGARACAWLTEEFTDKLRRGSFAQKGVDYAKLAIAANDKRVEGHYYLGINLGQSATTKTVGAYFMVKRVLTAANDALKLDEHFDHAGPARLVGTVYAKAPPWPASVGDVEEGIKFLKRAVETDAAFPQNHLHYGDALVADGKLNEAEHEYQLVLGAQDLPEWAHRAERWKHDATEGMKKIAEKRAAGSD